MQHVRRGLAEILRSLVLLAQHRSALPPLRPQVIATAPPQRTRAVHIVPHHQAQVGQARAADESSTDGQLRRVRQRRE